jgi:hypothetical protein
MDFLNLYIYIYIYSWIINFKNTKVHDEKIRVGKILTNKMKQLKILKGSRGGREFLFFFVNPDMINCFSLQKWVME